MLPKPWRWPPSPLRWVHTPSTQGLPGGRRRQAAVWSQPENIKNWHNQCARWCNFDNLDNIVEGGQVAVWSRPETRLQTWWSHCFQLPLLKKLGSIKGYFAFVHIIITITATKMMKTQTAESPGRCWKDASFRQDKRPAYNHFQSWWFRFST